MATPEVTNVVIDIIVAAFDGDPNKFNVFLKAGALDAQVQIENAKLRKLQAEAAAQQDEAAEAISTQAAALAAAQAAAQAYNESQ